MQSFITWIREERTRAYIYRGLVGTAPVVVLYGLLSSEEVVILLGAIGTWLGVGLAAKNTSTEPDERGAVSWAMVVVIALLVALLLLATGHLRL